MSSSILCNSNSTFNKQLVTTVITLQSKNSKTGNIPQVFYLPQEKPTDAVKTGSDKSICGNCPLRPLDAKSNNLPTCYVNKGHGPNSIHKVLNNLPLFRTLSLQQFKPIKAVRLGAYGDSASISKAKYLSIRKAVKSAFNLSDSHLLDYTHDWNNPKSNHLKTFAMASVETLKQAKKAWSNGWRTFRIIKDKSEITNNEICCPYSDKRVQCLDCQLCNGNQINAKSICITAH